MRAGNGRRGSLMRFVETDQTQSRYVESERIFHKDAEDRPFLAYTDYFRHSLFMTSMRHRLSPEEKQENCVEDGTATS